MKKPRYMHTLDGKPAWFVGGQVCYLGRRQAANTCATLAELKKQQEASRRFRLSKGFEDHSSYYDYALVRMSGENTRSRKI